jgi:hypothetical protein
MFYTSSPLFPSFSSLFGTYLLQERGFEMNILSEIKKWLSKKQIKKNVLIKNVYPPFIKKINYEKMNDGIDYFDYN